MHHICVNENALAPGEPETIRQRRHLDLPLQNINKLQILMPVHDLKARVPRIALVVDHMQHQIGEAGLAVQIDRVDIGRRFRFRHLRLAISCYSLTI